MSILAVSVSHKTTSVDVLSRVAMETATAGKLAEAMVGSDHVDEAVVLSTCNRTEMYAAVSRFHGGLDDIMSALAALSGVAVPELRQLCAVYFDEGAVAHTFAVASGLDSMVVGENQILGQVRSALTACQAHGTVGSVLNALFQQALRVGKRVHSETEIGSAGRSLVSTAYEVLENDLGPMTGRRLLVLGAGSMAGLAARTAVGMGARVTCVNRTYERARRLADSIGARARPLAELSDSLREADLVVACTGARDVFLDAERLEGSPVVGVVDLALPPDVSPDVIDGDIVLVNLARLVADQPDHASRTEVEAARALVWGEVNDFLGLRRSAQVAPTVVALRTMASEVVSAELARLDGRVPGLTDKERQEVHRAVRRVVDKLLHQPTVRVQELTADGQSVDYAAALRELFALDPQTVAAVMSPDVTTAVEPADLSDSVVAPAITASDDSA